MSRPKSDKTKSDRVRKPLDVTPILVRPSTLAQRTDTTEGWWRQLHARGDGPTRIRVGRLCLYDLDEAVQWLKRNAA